MADVNRGNRPLSPFMLGPYYRPQLNSVTSILTRITGNALIVAGLLITWWLVAAATGPEAFETANGVITSWFGDIVMLLSLWALWYHSLAGLRHLYWDTGRGFELEKVAILGWGIIAGSVILTVLTVIVI
ncbi:succinate dehydrogenase, cytochrome b556 subunit [Palleronia sediminis]|uniref:Succinate dehydrogenase cytochrome b556 subunit n=1 Tax=Palleronia sediminis TaxID=2547833 RepID=A0A4R6AHH0_9RHOB|nr:succinate dehydrogenase, cytochrome b556 subunit [Palleronia sediminis]TDL81908.1 succinate dehydrogenase, cytochrome b556 subunit [Palleronia sediminis]